MNNAIKYLDQILEWHKKNGRSLHEILNEGLSESKFSTLEREFGFKIPISLKSILKKYNGVSDNEKLLINDICFFPNFYFLSTTEALYDLKFRIELMDEFKNMEYWKKNWFPIATDGTSDLFVIQCNEKVIDDGPIIKFLNEEPERNIWYDSLESMLLTILSCFNQGAYYIKDDGCLDVDYELEIKISKKINKRLF